MKTKPTNKYVTFSSVVLVIQLVAAQCLFAQSSGQKDSVVFNFKPGEQSWLIPKGVTEVHISAYGAQGGSSTMGKGGKGGLVQSDLTVKPGTKLLIYVGSQPSGAEGGYNGGGKGCGNGGGGGGATDIRIDGSGLENRILVAGGGGGIGYAGEGGAGGGLTGGNGFYDTTSYHIAYGGTQQEGGKAARAYLSEDGKAGMGGNGLDNNGKCANDAMGGGGGGYYGGGSSGAGGGGGGSSFTNADSKNVIHQQGVNEGNGKLVIYFQQNKNNPY